MYPDVKTALNNTQPPPHSEFKLDKLGENACYYDEDIARNLLTQLSIHPIMVGLLIILRRIHCAFPMNCPIQIILIVSMLEFIVAYGGGKGRKTKDDLESYINFIRSEWGNVGKHINRKLHCDYIRIQLESCSNSNLSLIQSVKFLQENYSGSC